MNPTLAIFDVQHAGRASRPGDMGAAYDLDGDGVTGEQGEREVDLVRAYVEAAQAALERCGVEVRVLSSGEYGQRHLEAGNLARVFAGRAVYLACHLNAGRGRYALVRPDYRSQRGRLFASTMARHLRAVPELDDCRIWPLTSTDRGWACIDGIWSAPANLCGLLLEPYFLDGPTHRRLTTLQGTREVGAAVAAAVEEWGRS